MASRITAREEAWFIERARCAPWDLVAPDALLGSDNQESPQPAAVPGGADDAVPERHLMPLPDDLLSAAARTRKRWGHAETGVRMAKRLCRHRKIFTRRVLFFAAAVS
jgi:hypothetical protein